MEGAATEEPLWVFGYGSLVWRCGFEAVERRAPVCLRRYARVFAQGSTDHRGTPAAPGRVVTLEADAAGCVWGAAYRLPPPGRARDVALAYLEEREKQYDVRLRADLHASAVCGAHATADEPVVRRALLYVASPDRRRNANYMGPAPLADVAAVVAVAVGPSGPNCEYVYRLAAAMRALRRADPALFALEAAVRRLRCEPEEAVPAAEAVAEAEEAAAAACFSGVIREAPAEG